MIGHDEDQEALRESSRTMAGGVRRPGTRILATRDTQASLCGGIKKRRARIGRLGLLPASRGRLGCEAGGGECQVEGASGGAA